MNARPSIPAIACFLLGTAACHSLQTAQSRPHESEGVQPSGPSFQAPAQEAPTSGNPDSPSGSADPKTAGRPRDPMLAAGIEKDCGSALPNPHGIPLYHPPDGTCAACAKPGKTIPRCSEQAMGVDISLETLSQSTGKPVSLRGSLGIFPVWCTKAGGPCACNNHCWTPLRLMHADTKWDNIDPEAPVLVFDIASSYGASLLEAWPENYGQEGYLTCHGDEGSLCCPVQLKKSTRSAPVVAKGKLSSQNQDGHYSLKVESLCLLDDTPHP